MLILRIWTRNSEDWARESIIDIGKFATDCVLRYIDKNKFKVTIESFTNEIVDDFIKKNGHRYKRT